MTSWRRVGGLLVLLFVVVHAALLLHVARDPAAFLTCDRATARFEKIRAVFAGARSAAELPELARHPISGRLLAAGPLPEDPAARIVALGGPPGDHLLQGALWALGGPWLVQLVQLGLALAGLGALLAIARRLGLAPPWALLAGLIYLLLPASLSQPHQLVSEALFNPLVLLGLAGVLPAVQGERRRPALAAGLAALGLAAAIRPQLLLLPALLVPLLVRRLPGGERWRAAALAVALCLLPTLLWVGLRWLEGAGIGLGDANSGLPRNLFLKAVRVANLAGTPLDPAAYPTGEMPPGDALRFLLAHPLAWLRLTVAENANLFGNAGINQLLGDFLRLPLFEFGQAWNDLRRQAGPAEIGRAILAQDPVWLATFALATLLWLGLLALALLGLYRLGRAGRLHEPGWLLLLGYGLYTLLVVQLATTRLGHRSAVEFVLALLVAAALAPPLPRAVAPRPATPVPTGRPAAEPAS